MTLTISNIDKETEAILTYIAKKAGGKVRKRTTKQRTSTDEAGFVNEMERIIRDIEKDFYASKKNSHHKELRKRA